MASTIYSKAGADAAIAAAVDAIPAPGGGGTDALTVVAANTTPDAGTVVGQLAGYWNTNASAVTVAAVTLPAGQAVVLMWDGAAWVQPSMLSAAAPDPTPDPTDPVPPAAGILSASQVTSTGMTLTVTGASDDVALHATPYRVTVGSTPGAWQASHTYTATGLTASTAYICSHETRDAAANIAAGTPITVTTSAPANQPPTVTITSLTADQLAATLAFTGTDADGDTLTYTVDWGDDATSSAAPWTHTYAADGGYVVTVTASDGKGGIAQDTDTLNVSGGGGYTVGQVVIGHDFSTATAGEIVGQTTQIGGVTWAGTAGVLSVDNGQLGFAGSSTGYVGFQVPPDLVDYEVVVAYADWTGGTTTGQIDVGVRYAAYNIYASNDATIEAGYTYRRITGHVGGTTVLSTNGVSTYAPTAGQTVQSTIGLGYKAGQWYSWRDTTPDVGDVLTPVTVTALAATSLIPGWVSVFGRIAGTWGIKSIQVRAL